MKEQEKKLIELKMKNQEKIEALEKSQKTMEKLPPKQSALHYEAVVEYENMVNIEINRLKEIEKRKKFIKEYDKTTKAEHYPEISQNKKLESQQRVNN